jgi:hypothetical protein
MFSGATRLAALSGILCLLIFEPKFVFAANDSAKAKSGFIPIPAVYYTPETAVAAGGLFIYYFRNDDDPAEAKPSQIKPIVILTEKKQLITSLLLSRRWNGGKDHLSIFSRYRRYPDKIWGVGPRTTPAMEEDYSSNIASVEASWERETSFGWSLGPVAIQSAYQVTTLAPDGALASGALTGSEGARSGGVGMLFTRDTRDNLFAPMAGAFDTLRLIHFKPMNSRDRPYNDVQLEARRYFNLTGAQVFGFRLFCQGQNGDVPFRELASIGGPDRMRGYYEGRYRDKVSVIGEAEYRFPIWGRFRGAGFASAGNVAGTIDQIAATPAKYSVGGGIRFVVDEDERIGIRVDYGKSPESEGMYVQLNEAF